MPLIWFTWPQFISQQYPCRENESTFTGLEILTFLGRRQLATDTFFSVAK